MDFIKVKASLSKMRKLSAKFMSKFLPKFLTRFVSLFNSSPRRKIISAVCLFLFAVALYYSIALLRISDEEIALANLEKSYADISLCHENCYLYRLTQEKLIVQSLKQGSDKIAKRLEKYWQSEEVSLDFKKEIINIIAQTNRDNNMPKYMNSYLVREKSDPVLVREILSKFTITINDKNAVAASLVSDINSATSSDAKIELLKTLASVKNDSEISNYFNILSSENSLDLKRQAVKNISNILEKGRYFSLEQLGIIQTLVATPETDARLRQDLVFLLGDYYLVFPAESLAAWQNIYNNAALDNISRLFSADNLNMLSNSRLEMPLVASSEWDNYYNN